MSTTNTVIRIGQIKQDSTVDIAIQEAASAFKQGKHIIEDLYAWANSFAFDPAALVAAGWTQQKANDQIAAIQAGASALQSLSANPLFTKYLAAGGSFGS